MAVYTEVPNDELATFVARYDIGAVLSCKGIAEGVENIQLPAPHGDRHYILTLYEKRVDPADLPFFLGLMEHLAARGISCPTPLKTAAGEALGMLAGRPAAMVTFLDGLSVRRPTPDHCAEVGGRWRACIWPGRIFRFNAANACRSATGGRCSTCRGARRRGAPGLRARSQAELDGLRRLAAICRAALSTPTCFPTMSSSSARLSGIIDFYFACNDCFAYDSRSASMPGAFEADLSSTSPRRARC